MTNNDKRRKEVVGMVLTKEEKLKEGELFLLSFAGEIDGEEAMELNDIQREKAKRLFRKFGALYGISVDKGKIEEITSEWRAEHIKNFEFDYLIPAKNIKEGDLKRLKELLEEAKREISMQILDEIDYIVEKSGGVRLYWY